jgi:hypothetical protein
MPKIAFIGAGSTVFAKNLMDDILSFPEIPIAKAIVMSEAYLITSPELESEIAIHGGIMDKIAEFAIWFRSIIPLSYKLAMMITSFNRESLELNSHTTSDDIIQHFGR